MMMSVMSLKVILSICIIAATFYLLRNASNMSKLYQEIEKPSISTAPINWKNTDVQKLNGTKTEMGLLSLLPKSLLAIANTFNVTRITVGEDPTSQTEEKPFANLWRNNALTRKQALDFANICNTHSDDLIFIQAKQLYNLAGLSISQRFDYKILGSMSEILGPRLYNSTSYRYDIQWTLDKLRHNVYMKIKETFLGKSTNGGSSFRIHVHGVHSFLCNVRDNFNGMYDVCCPYVPPCSNITVTLMYLSYGAFLDIKNIEPTALILARIETCGLHNTDQRSLKQFETDMIRDSRMKCNRDAKFLSKYGRWILNNGSLTWGLHSKCLIKSMTPTKLRECFKNLSYISSYGDSHLCYTMTYFEQLLRNNTVYHKTGSNWGFDGDHLTFRWCPYVEQISKYLQKEHNPTIQVNATSKPKLKDPRHSTVVLINNGAWDLDLGTFSNYLYSIQTSLVPLIRKYRQNPTWRTIRFIWVGASAFPHKPGYLNKGHHTRNDFRAAVANALVESLTKNLDVDFMDQLTASSIMSASNVCKVHYICTKKFKKSHRARGMVGKVMADLLFNEMCR